MVKVRHQLKLRNEELRDAKKETESALLQIHQLQEEVEHNCLEIHKIKQINAPINGITPALKDQITRISLRLEALCEKKRNANR